MRTSRLYLVLLGCLQPSLCFNNDLTNYTLPSSLKQYCPLTDFCTDSAGSYNLRDDLEPCCQACSCSPDCAVTHNCCDDGFASSEYVDYTNCEYAGLTRNLKLGMYYVMVDKCPDLNTNCRNKKVAPWGSIYPVTSPTNKKTFINNNCALCHNITDGVFWDFVYMCPLSVYTESLSVKDFMHGSRQCSVEFYPRDVGSDRPEQCYKTVIRECISSIPKENLTEDLEFLCKAFNATFVDQTAGHDGEAYGNVYCFLCNLGSVDKYESECTYPIGEPPRKGIHKQTLIALVDFEAMEALLKMYDTQSKLAEGLRIVNACDLKLDVDEGSCRPVECPEGQLRLSDSGCQHVSKQWTNVNLTMLVNLTYEPNSEMVPLQCLIKESNSDASKNIFLRQPNLIEYSSLLFVHQSADRIYADNFVAKLSFKPRTLEPKKFFTRIKNALSSVWEIWACRKKYLLKGQINNYISTPNPNFDAINIAMAETKYYLPRWTLNEATGTFRTAFELQAAEATKESLIMHTDGLWLIKTFFCNQIQLYDQEFMDNDDRLYIIKMGKFLGDGEYRQVRIPGYRKVFKAFACLDDFRKPATSNFALAEPRDALVIFLVVFGLWGVYLL